MKNFKLVLMAVAGLTFGLGAADAAKPTTTPTTAPVIAPVKLTAEQVKAQTEVLTKVVDAAKAALAKVDVKDPKALEVANKNVTDAQAALDKFVTDNESILGTVARYAFAPFMFVNGYLVKADQYVMDTIKPVTSYVSEGYNSTVTFVTTRPVTMVAIAAAGGATYYAYTQYSKSTSKKARS